MAALLCFGPVKRALANEESTLHRSLKSIGFFRPTDADGAFLKTDKKSRYYARFHFSLEGDLRDATDEMEAQLLGRLAFFGGVETDSLCVISKKGVGSIIFEIGVLRADAPGSPFSPPKTKKTRRKGAFDDLEMAMERETKEADAAVTAAGEEQLAGFVQKVNETSLPDLSKALSRMVYNVAVNVTEADATSPTKAAREAKEAAKTPEQILFELTRDLGEARRTAARLERHAAEVEKRNEVLRMEMAHENARSPGAVAASSSSPIAALGASACDETAEEVARAIHGATHLIRGANRQRQDAEKRAMQLERQIDALRAAKVNSSKAVRETERQNVEIEEATDFIKQKTEIFEELRHAVHDISEVFLEPSDLEAHAERVLARGGEEAYDEYEDPYYYEDEAAMPRQREKSAAQLFIETPVGGKALESPPLRQHGKRLDFDAADVEEEEEDLDWDWPRGAEEVARVEKAKAKLKATAADLEYASKEQAEEAAAEEYYEEDEREDSPLCGASSPLCGTASNTRASPPLLSARKPPTYAALDAIYPAAKAKSPEPQSTGTRKKRSPAAAATPPPPPPMPESAALLEMTAAHPRTAVWHSRDEKAKWHKSTSPPQRVSGAKNPMPLSPGGTQTAVTATENTPRAEAHPASLALSFSTVPSSSASNSPHAKLLESDLPGPPLHGVQGSGKKKRRKHSGATDAQTRSHPGKLREGRLQDATPPSKQRTPSSRQRIYRSPPPALMDPPTYPYSTIPPPSQPAAVLTVTAPPTADDPRYEVLFDGSARVALYNYNDILLRKDTPGLVVDPNDMNGPFPAYLVIDGWTPLGTDAGHLPPRVLAYSSSEHYYMLKLAKAPPLGSLHTSHLPSHAVAAAAATTVEVDYEVGSAAAYRLTEGEALRHVQLLRERPEGAQDLVRNTAKPSKPTFSGYYYDVEPVSLASPSLFEA